MPISYQVTYFLAFNSTYIPQRERHKQRECLLYWKWLIPSNIYHKAFSPLLTWKSLNWLVLGFITIDILKSVKPKILSQRPVLQKNFKRKTSMLLQKLVLLWETDHAPHKGDRKRSMNLLLQQRSQCKFCLLWKQAWENIYLSTLSTVTWYDIPFIAGLYLYLLSSLQSFQSVECPSFLHLMHYLCPKLNISEIPKRTCMGDVVMAKVAKLDEIDLNLMVGIDSLVSIVYNGWSSKWCHSFASYSI